MGWGGVGDCYVGYLKSLFARLTVDIRLIALIVIPVLGNMSSEFEGKGMQTLPYISEVCNDVLTENFVKNKRILLHNRFLKTNLVLGGLQACITKCDKRVGDLKTGKQPYFMDGPLRQGMGMTCLDNSWNGNKR